MFTGPVRLFLLLAAAFLFQFTLFAQQDQDWHDLAEMRDQAELEKALRERIQAAETIDGRLTLLEDAEAEELLRPAARRIRIELLLLGGRTEEAETLLQDSLPQDDFGSGLGERLAITHGRASLPEKRGAEQPFKLSREGITALAAGGTDTPEGFAEQRGSLISTGLLFSPYQPETADLPAGAGALPSQSEDTAGKSVTIQLGAFAERSNARAHLEYLSGRNIDGTIIEEQRGSGGSIYKTVIQNVPESDAQRRLIQLKEQGIEGFILQ